MRASGYGTTTLAQCEPDRRHHPYIHLAHMAHMRDGTNGSATVFVGHNGWAHSSVTSVMRHCPSNTTPLSMNTWGDVMFP